MSQPTSQTSGYAGDTPAKYRHNSNSSVSSKSPQEGRETQRDMAEDLLEENLGGMPVQTFFDEFLPGDGLAASAKVQNFRTCGNTPFKSALAFYGSISHKFKSGSPRELSKRIQHRILEDFVPYTLDICKNAKEMMTFIHHAFLAHRRACKLRILHRDIGHHNVLVMNHEGETLEAVLIDWDLCLRLKDKTGVPKTSTGPHQRFRTGTWYFMSTELLREPGKSHLLRDDLESFLYLVLYLSIIWFNPVDLKINDVDYFIKHMFQQVDKARDGGYLGGSNKLAMLREFSFIGSRYSFKNNRALTVWSHRAHRLFRNYYVDKLQLALQRDDQSSQLIVDEQLEDDARLKEAETRLRQSTVLLDDHDSIQELFGEALSSPEGEWSPHKANVPMRPKRGRTASES